MATQLFQSKAPHGSPTWLHSMIAKAGKNIVTEVVTLTPPLAKALLDLNPDNRSVRGTKVQQYSSDMAAGRWSLNGEPIIISSDGNMNDGQHRCYASIDANASVPVVMMFGVDRETRLTLDTGAARGAADFLSMEGVENAAITAAIARLVIAFDANGGSSLAGNQHLTSTQIRQRVATDKLLAEAATFGNTNAAYSKRFAAGSLIGFSYYVLARVNREEAKSFLAKVCRGDGLRINEPGHTLREKLINEGKTPRDRKIAMILKAWNFHRRGMKVRLASLSSTLPFPALI